MFQAKSIFEIEIGFGGAEVTYNLFDPRVIIASSYIFQELHGSAGKAYIVIFHGGYCSIINREH